ncbi:MAG: helix-turn-helix transcriptional regulator [Pseudomonadota bacterium]
MADFGKKFGRLVRKKRGIEGLTQEKLSFSSDVPKARISQLENGRISNPQARTIDALCVALDISNEERIACHEDSGLSLSTQLLENLATGFGNSNPKATEADMIAFLKGKAVEYHELRRRLDELAEVDERLSLLLASTKTAIDQGDFQKADKLLEQAENIQFDLVTKDALVTQATLRMERGNAALLSGYLGLAVEHFETAANYFSGINKELEAKTRHKHIDLLRSYAYRYRDAESLHAAREFLVQNLGIWTEDTFFESWCMTRNALGGVAVRLAQFDDVSRTHEHLKDAKENYEIVRTSCSSGDDPKSLAIATLDLANVHLARSFSNSDEQFLSNLSIAIELQYSALDFFTVQKHPREWGIVHHNLGCSHTSIAALKKKTEAIEHLQLAIKHLEQSFDVRSPEAGLQYWVASCRSLGEALISYADLSHERRSEYIQRADRILQRAQSHIDQSEHPNQWAEIETQKSRLLELS